MSLTDFLIGNSSLKRQRDKAVDYARDMYDPSMFQPSINQASTQAGEGIGQERRDIMRSRTVQSLFTPTDSATFRGNQASQLSAQQEQTEARQQALAGFESRLAEADIQVQQQGEQDVADLQTQQRQVQGQQEAAIDEADMMYEAEKSRRKQALAGAALGLVGNLVTTPFGPAGQSLVGKGLGSLVGGGEEDGTPSTSEALANMARSINTPEAPQDTIMEDVNIPNFEIDFSTNQLKMQNQPLIPMGDQPRDNVSGVSVGGSWEDDGSINVDADNRFGMVGEYATGEIDPTLLGERTFGRFNNAVGNIFGPIVGGVSEAVTFPSRVGLNVANLGYRAATQTPFGGEESSSQQTNYNFVDEATQRTFEQSPQVQNLFGVPDTESSVNVTSLFGDYEQQYNLPEGLLEQMMQTESSGNPQAVSPKGAQGLFQFMPETADELGIDPFNPEEATEGAAKYMSQLIDQFGSLEQALAAYNAGMGNVRKYGGVPPFAETQNYVQQIMGNLNI